MNCIVLTEEILKDIFECQSFAGVKRCIMTVLRQFAHPGEQVSDIPNKKEWKG